MDIRVFGWVNSPAHLGIPGRTKLAATMDLELCGWGDHAAVYLEHCVTGWLLKLVGSASRSANRLARYSMASYLSLAATDIKVRQWDGMYE